MGWQTKALKQEPEVVNQGKVGEGPGLAAGTWRTHQHCLKTHQPVLPRAALGSPWPSCEALSTTVLCPLWAFLHGCSFCLGSPILARTAPPLPRSQLTRLKLLPESFMFPVFIIRPSH